MGQWIFILFCGLKSNIIFYLKKVRYNSPFFKYRLYIVPSFQRWQGGSGEKVRRKQLTNTTSVIWFQLTPSVNRWCVPVTYVEKGISPLWYSLPPTPPIPHFKHKRSIMIFQIKIEGHSSTNTIKTVKVINSKGSLKNCHRQEKPKESWQLNVILCLKYDIGTDKVIK